MEKEFIPYELAVEFKELSFNEPCLASYYRAGKRLDIREYINHGEYTVLAPTYSQAFRWFREKYDLAHYIYRNDDEMIEYVKSREGENLFKYRCGYSDGTSYPIKGCHTYEEAEFECLKELIKIIKNKN
jgi:hypothetical protein